MFLSFQSRASRETGAKLYQTAVRQSRRTIFYQDMGVPDTVDGRFDLLCLHVFLVIDRLGTAGREGRKLGQAVFDQMFLDMDRSVREMGIGDLSVPKHMRRMMKAFNGRSRAYSDVLKSGKGLDKVLERNIYGGQGADPATLRAMEAYVRQCRVLLAAQPDQALLEGAAEFPKEQDNDNDRNAAERGMVA